MTQIKEILTLDLHEDIKHVIDLEDRSENEIQQEIETYIVTQGISDHLDKFINQYTTNIKETGVWISGFYGSGKSYFGKMLGYLIANPKINGTNARDRFMPRLDGIEGKSLIENSIRKLDSIDSRVVFMDIAKQNTDRGLPFTLFANLLNNLGFRSDIYGYIEYDLFIDGKFDEFQEVVKKHESGEWNKLKKSNRLVGKIMRKIHMEMGYSDKDYEHMYNTYSEAIRDFSTNKFKFELEKYLKINPDETIVFMFDEASEAVSQNKFSLLDLEGISEALSSITQKVWTVAIAQEKLDKVIDNANVNRSQLTKVTDRFKTKIHLESKEVDIIIKSRLLHKKEQYYQNLTEYYKSHEGSISDATNLKSSFPTKTTNADDFATYYPFHRYQFDILQKFLFSSNALIATQIAARGMIITTFDVLRKQMQNQTLYDFTTGHTICSEAQTAPPVGLVNKYDTATKILDDKNLQVEGEKLLKTIHLLSDSEVISPTVENITKSYMADIQDYYKIKPEIENCLKLLVDAKVLLLTNNNYKITSDMESKLLEEMKEFDVELYQKKRSYIKYLKEYKLFNSVSTYNDGSVTYKFNITSSQDDELAPSGNKQLRFQVYSIFNLGENRQDFIEQKKMDTQNEKNLVTLIPDNEEFATIDTLISDISKYSYMEEKYATESDSNKRKIIRQFSLIREEKEKDLRLKIQKAHYNGSLIYLYDENLLNEDNFTGTIREVQKKLIKNLYTKRLPSQLSESIIPKIFRNRKDKLSQLFFGDDFKFFDDHGNFTGDHLKVVEEIKAKISNRKVDGRTLEGELSKAPWGYTFGTIATTLAAMFRAGRVYVRFNSVDWFSCEEKNIQDVFTNATKFRTASYKSINKSLSGTQKQHIVQALMDLEIDRYIDTKVDWNTNDFDLTIAISTLANHFIDVLRTLSETVDLFDMLFAIVASQKVVLQNYSVKITENNYIDKAEYFLDTKDEFAEAVQTILKAKSFIGKKLPKVKEYKDFIKNVVAELDKAEQKNKNIEDASGEFSSLYNEEMVKNFTQLQNHAQSVKDEYFKMVKNAAQIMTIRYGELRSKVNQALQDLRKKYPEEPNRINRSKLETLKQYCEKRIMEDPELEYSVTCKNTGFSLSDMMNYTALVPTKENELVLITSSFIKEVKKQDTTETTTKSPRKVKLQLHTKHITVRQYKKVLTDQLSALATALPDEEIELDVETLE